MKSITSFGGSTAGSKTSMASFSSGRENPVFGIDLGTTNSAISVIKEGKVPESIILRSGKYTMPSCVMWHDGEFVVGDEAYLHREQENVIYSVKRLMQTVGATVTLKDRNDKITLTAAEVSAKILRGIVDQTDGFYGEIKDVVVTVPAYFDQNGISATREACELAGLNLIAIANEPTAASLCYDLNPSAGESSKDAVIYDLGGGTFDVTLTRITSSEGQDDLAALYDIETEDVGGDKIVSTLAIDGDAYLGGDDVDKEMLKIVFGKLRAEGIDGELFKDVYKEQLILRLEGLKKSGVRGRYDMSISTIDKTGREVKTTVHVYPEDFRDALMPIYEKTRDILRRLLQSVNNTADTIVLVGGSTKNDWLVDMLSEDFPSFKLDNALNPDLSVSNGAAIQGKVTKFGDAAIQIFDILPISIGILDDSVVSPFIAKGTSLPVSSKSVFTTVVDNQTTLDVQLFQGNSLYKEECVSLGTLHLTDITPKPAGEPNLVITVTISADRLMTCKASIDGITKELKLNLAGDTGSLPKLGREDKKLIRWRTFASKLSGADALEFTTLLEAYQQGGSEDAIKQFIREHRSLAEGV